MKLRQKIEMTEENERNGEGESCFFVVESGGCKKYNFLYIEKYKKEMEWLTNAQFCHLIRLHKLWNGLNLNLLYFFLHVTHFRILSSPFLHSLWCLFNLKIWRYIRSKSDNCFSYHNNSTCSQFFHDYYLDKHLFSPLCSNWFYR